MKLIAVIFALSFALLYLDDAESAAIVDYYQQIPVQQ